MTLIRITPRRLPPMWPAIPLALLVVAIVIAAMLAMDGFATLDEMGMR